MTVNELIEILLQYPGHIEVRKEHELILHEIQQKDIELFDFGEQQRLVI